MKKKQPACKTEVIKKDGNHVTARVTTGKTVRIIKVHSISDLLSRCDKT